MTEEPSSDLNNQWAYEQFAKTYAALVEHTGRADSEVNLLIDLTRRAGLCPESKLLDLGCGPGVVAQKLRESRNYTHLFALDASPAMCSQAKRRLSVDKVICASWNSLEEQLTGVAPFDLIYSLSQSVTHAASTELPRIFSSVFDLLRPGGIFLMDVRPWLSLNEIERREPQRHEGIWRIGSHFVDGGNEYWVDDCCSYASDRQFVTYRILTRPVKSMQSLTKSEFTVSYNTVCHEGYRSLLLDAGFTGVEQLFTAEWPYVIIEAAK